jgi:DNA mismatch repair protein MutL
VDDGSDPTADDRVRAGSDERSPAESSPTAGGDAGHPGAPRRSTDPSGHSRGGESAGGTKFSGDDEQRTLDGERAAPESEYDRLPRMRVLGQFDGTYLVAETPDGLALVDQHAADERVHYERLRAAFEAGTTSQRLADPVELELTAGESATFSAAREALTELGFDAELLDGDGSRRRLRVRAVPAVFDATLSPERLTDVLDSVVDGDPAETVDELADRFLADLACYPSITGNTSLTEGSVTELLSALDDCENPYACPHGRPVVIELDRSEVEDRFERDYPGHGPH